MKTKLSYSEKLKDPRWQKKRLEVLEAFGFKCSECQSEEKTLHVHHNFYKKNKQPWEYDKFDLCVLCEECHPIREALKERVIQSIGYFNNSDLELMSDLISMSQCGPWSFPNLVNFLKTFRDDSIQNYEK